MADIRSFIAIAVDKAIIARLAEVQQELRRADAQVQWVRPEGIHITLKFLGNVPEERIAPIAAALQGVAAHHAPFRVRVAGVGAFPSLRRPRVVWAGIEEGAAPLGALAAEVEEAMARLDFPREDRPYSPHLTLGRVKYCRENDPFAAILRALPSQLFGEMTAGELRVMRSDLSPAGARYTALHVIPLGG